MKPAIRVENLSKSYRLGTRTSSSYQTLRDTISDSVAGAWEGLRRRFGGASNGTANGHTKDDAFWALKDVSFEVQPGEVVGIIGRNGAGKSTLLKILSRIVDPTTGRCEVRGRMASLLEVGTGFHPELTGRENIFMNGSILGMSRKEIDRKFDEIVDFAEIEQFLDTPVKRYSSGMYVRLAFAVAAHLEPESLVIDEVLAVGDGSFQKKCLGKMAEVSGQGRTILFVSHNMAALTSLCEKAVWLERGEVVTSGPACRVVREYLTKQFGGGATGVRELTTAARGGGDQSIRFTSVEFRSVTGHVTGQFGVGERVGITLRLESDLPLEGEVGYTIKTLEGVALFTSSSNDSGKLLSIPAGKSVVETSIEPNYLRPGKYILQLGTTCNTCRDFIPEAGTIEIVSDRHYSDGQLYGLPGHLFFPFKWGQVREEN
ncbi:MAG: ABC transporter ATP-binding protein [Gemmataceae bacterium]